MSDETPRNDDGTFAPAEPLLGQEGIEADLGYVPMPEPEQDHPEPESDLRTEVERLQASRAPEADPVVEIQYQRLDNGEKMPINQTVSLERAADDLGSWHAAQNEDRARSVSADFAKELDRSRGELLKANPELAKEQLGLSDEEVAAAEAAKAEADGEKPAAIKAEKNAQPEDEPSPYDSVEGLEPATREALKNPQIREAVEKEFSKVAEAQTQYAEGLKGAHQFGQAALLAVAPELAQVPVEMWGEAVGILAQSNPARAQQVAQLLQNVQTIAQAQAYQTYQQTQEQRQQVETLRRQYNDASAKFLPKTVAEQTQLAEDFADYVGELGVSREQLLHEWKNNLALHHPAFQRMVVDAMKYRAIQKAPKAAAHRDLPPVQRPGTSVHRSSGDNSSQIRALQNQLWGLTGDKAVRAAAKLARLQRKA
jgi:hypothetical protein